LGILKTGAKVKQMFDLNKRLIKKIKIFLQAGKLKP
jgi:hypothetical protein